MPRTLLCRTAWLGCSRNDNVFVRRRTTACFGAARASKVRDGHWSGLSLQSTYLLYALQFGNKLGLREVRARLQVLTTWQRIEVLAAEHASSMHMHSCLTFSVDAIILYSS
jgi:hypothetical protein